MRAVIQRVTDASVTIARDNHVSGAIDHGFLILLGVTHGDDEPQCKAMAKKIAAMRIFQDQAGKMNLALADVGGKALVVSQFTLYADCRHGNRPGFSDAAPPEQAEKLYEMFCAELTQFGIEVQKGVFGASMLVKLVNNGPVTIILDSDNIKV